MGVSTDGQICYGIKFDGEYNFPWDDDQWESIDDWWIYGVCGYKNPFEMFDEAGSWIGGARWPEGKIRTYYDTKYDFEKEHPLPIELVKHCHNDYPMYILAVSSTCLVASRGYPENFDPFALSVSEEEKKSWLRFVKCTTLIVMMCHDGGFPVIGVDALPDAFARRQRAARQLRQERHRHRSGSAVVDMVRKKQTGLSWGTKVRQNATAKLALLAAVATAK
jgi:hypothetical protein